MDLLSEDRPSTEIPECTEQFRHIKHNVDVAIINSTLIFFDLETSGFRTDDDVLQIAMKCGSKIFNQYIKPYQPIPLRVTAIHGLSNQEGRLYRFGRPVFAASRNQVLNDLLDFLQDCMKGTGKQCLLIAHNCSFDFPRLFKLIENAHLIDEFQKVIKGFCDTLPIFKKNIQGPHGKGSLKLTSLAKKENLDVENAHDALIDVCLLEIVAFRHISVQEFEEFMKSYNYITILNGLDPLAHIISKNIRQRMANAGLSLMKLLDTLENDGEETVKNLLKQTKNGKDTVIKLQKHVNAIVMFLHEKNSTF